MLCFSYRVELEAGEEGGLVVSFPGVPEAITEGDDRREALANASEALGLALLTYAEIGRPFPAGDDPDAPGVVTVEPEVAAKVALIAAFRQSGLTKTQLAERIGRDEKEVRRLLDPMHASKMKPLRAALAVLGKRLVTGVADLETLAIDRAA